MGFSFILSSFFASGRVYLFCASQRKGTRFHRHAVHAPPKAKPPATWPASPRSRRFRSAYCWAVPSQPSLIDGGNKSAAAATHRAPPGVSPVFAFHTSVDALNQHFTRHLARLSPHTCFVMPLIQPFDQPCQSMSRWPISINMILVRDSTSLRQHRATQAHRAPPPQLRREPFYPPASAHRWRSFPRRTVYGM